MSDDVRIAMAVASKTRKIWESLVLFFRTKGYILFVAELLEKEHAQGLYPAGKFRDNLELDLEPPFARWGQGTPKNQESRKHKCV